MDACTQRDSVAEAEVDQGKKAEETQALFAKHAAEQQRIDEAWAVRSVARYATVYHEHGFLKPEVKGGPATQHLFPQPAALSQVADPPPPGGPAK